MIEQGKKSLGILGVIAILVSQLGVVNLTDLLGDRGQAIFQFLLSVLGGLVALFSKPPVSGSGK